MDNIIAAFSGVPVVAIYGLIATMLAGVGMIAGRVFAIVGLKYTGCVTVIALAATPVVTQEFIMPRIANAQANRNLPMMVDNVTRLVRIEIARQALHPSL